MKQTALLLITILTLGSCSPAGQSTISDAGLEDGGEINILLGNSNQNSADAQESIAPQNPVRVLQGQYDEGVVKFCDGRTLVYLYNGGSRSGVAMSTIPFSSECKTRIADR